MFTGAAASSKEVALGSLVVAAAIGLVGLAGSFM